ncbi:unnamed protein product [Protopolystoma xenopodis]|uniref:Uncharacterized protein n=1 Tax=Protopolystoma xenopodis TaxID=117903 RepID=A0A3S5AHU7_9PLAT|nr:unnamed protein product [Protopolystoma xenopodis]
MPHSAGTRRNRPFSFGSTPREMVLSNENWLSALYFPVHSSGRGQQPVVEESRRSSSPTESADEERSELQQIGQFKWKHASGWSDCGDHLTSGLLAAETK